VTDFPLQVLTVCTGNICRSPMMERFLQAAIDQRGARGGVVVTSAGTWANPGEPMQPFAAAMLNQRGVDATGFGATSLTEELVRASDLVITATREHRSRVVGLVPGAVRRTFTLLELARIASSGPVPAPPSAPAPAGSAGFAESVRQTVAWAAQMRGSVSRHEDSADDLDDPLGAPLEVYRQRADSITAAVEQIVPFLIGGQGATTAG
jgi:protein-tyrosine phosphatase